MTIFPKWLLKTDKIPNPKGSFPKNAKKIPGNGCMDDLLFYVLFNSISVTDYMRVIMMELFLQLERSPTPPPSRGESNQGWITCHFMFFQTVFRLYPPPPPPPSRGGGFKPGMNNLPFHVLLNSISIISG